MTTPKYARVEDEQRFLVSNLPAEASDPRMLTDRYLTGTRLRLRLLVGAGPTVRKLGHKVRLDGAGPSAVWHTTCYLDEAEYDLLAALPAGTVEKRRWSLPGSMCADEFLGALRGLVLIEGPRPTTVQGTAVEVTDDEGFTGGALAGLDDHDGAAFVAAARRRVS